MKHFLAASGNRLFAIVLGMLFLASCTKNELVEYEHEPLNKILEYEVTNSPQHLMGAIDQVENIIRVYLPYYANVDYLIVRITLDEGATLLRSDSTAIDLVEDELDPVNLGDTVQYIVRSADQQYRTYTLIQDILPHSEALHIVGYGNTEFESTWNFEMHYTEDGIYPICGNGLLYLFGNFSSNSSMGKFTLKNRDTGIEHTDYMNILSVSPRHDGKYVMAVRVSPEAMHGTYDLQLQHQGRVTEELAPLQIYYQLAQGEYLSSSSSYAVGDTITFTAEKGYGGVGTFPTPKRAFVRINRSTRDGDVPPDFPEELYGKEIDMEIVDHSRSEIKVVFPDVPIGLYRNYDENVINILTTFHPEEGYEPDTPFDSEVKAVRISGLGFTVLPKSQ